MNQNTCSAAATHIPVQEEKEEEKKMRGGGEKQTNKQNEKENVFLITKKLNIKKEKKGKIKKRIP